MEAEKFAVEKGQAEDPYKKAFVDRFGTDATFYYAIPKTEQVVVMTIDQAFLVSGQHIRDAFGDALKIKDPKERKTTIASLWLGLEEAKNQADGIRETSSGQYEQLVEAGLAFMSDFENRQKQQR